MATLSESRNLVRLIQLRISNVKFILVRFQTQIEENNFNVSLWQSILTGSRLFLEQYVTAYQFACERNEQLFTNCRFFVFYFHHLIDLYVRENIVWVRAHRDFIEQQIDAAQEVIQLCEGETLRIDNLIRLE